jgi:hypothetical protein
MLGFVVMSNPLASSTSWDLVAKEYAEVTAHSLRTMRVLPSTALVFARGLGLSISPLGRERSVGWRPDAAAG